MKYLCLMELICLGFIYYLYLQFNLSIKHYHECGWSWNDSTYHHTLHYILADLNNLSRYCSNFYPKAESYRTCNWCLREEGERSLPKEAMKDPNSLVSSSSNNDSSNDSGASKLHRGDFSSQLNKPIKKPRLLDWSASDVTDRVWSGELSSGSGRARQVLRGKARRYKLLEEVSS